MQRLTRAAWLFLLAACDGPTLSLAQRTPRPDASPEDDDEADDERTPCDDPSDCADLGLCDPVRALCVECLTADDCAPGQRCEADGECDD